MPNSWSPVPVGPAGSTPPGAAPVESPVITIVREGTTVAGYARFLVRKGGQCLWTSAPTLEKALAGLAEYLKPFYAGAGAYRAADDQTPPEPPTEMQEIRAALAEIRAAQISQHAEVKAELTDIAEHLVVTSMQVPPTLPPPAPETVFERLSHMSDDYWPEDLLGPAPDWTPQLGFSRDGKYKGLIEPLTADNPDKVFAAAWCGVNLVGNAGGDWPETVKRHQFIREVMAGTQPEFARVCMENGIEPNLAFYLVLDGSVDPIAGSFDTGRWKDKAAWYRGKTAAEYVAKEIARLSNQPGGNPGMGGA